MIEYYTIGDPFRYLFRLTLLSRVIMARQFYD